MAFDLGAKTWSAAAERPYSGNHHAVITLNGTTHGQRLNGQHGCEAYA